MVISVHMRHLLAASMIAAAPWHASQLGAGTQSSWTTAQTLLIRDAASFKRAWNQLHPLPALRPALPAVNFSRYRVVVVAAGTRPTGGYRLALTDAHVARDSALITITLFTPASGCGVSQELTTPAIAIATPVAPRPIRIILQERADTVRCS